MGWKLKETEEFAKQFGKLSNEIKFRFKKQFEKVEQNPYALGKPLDYKWFRELKKLIEERQKLANKVCLEIIKIEAGITKIPDSKK